jgi:hypothetical protein
MGKGGRIASLIARSSLPFGFNANLRIINADCNDLEKLERRTSAIASNLRAINEDVRQAGGQDRGVRARH